MIGSCFRFLLLLFLSFLLTFSGFNFSGNRVTATSILTVEEQQGREWYQQGNIHQAIATWLKIVEDYEQQDDFINQGKVLSYLALAYSQLGQWQQADNSINQSLDLLQSQPQDDTITPILAEAFNIQGTLLLAKGNPLAALSSWEKATTTYEKVKDSSGILRTNINQSRALQSLGLYTQACQKLANHLIDDSLSCNELTFEKITDLLSNNLTPLQQAGWLSLAQLLRQQGNLDSSEVILNNILAQVSSSDFKASILLNLGKNLDLQNDIEGAKDNYQQALTTATNLETKLKVQLSHLNLLLGQKSWIEAQQLLIDIENDLSRLSLNQTKIDIHWLG